jgi:hypothetical protein
MKRILQGLPFAVAGLWLLTSMLVLALATWRARLRPERVPAAIPLLPPAAPSDTPAPVELTLAPVVVEGRAPPRPALPRAAPARSPSPVWRCSGWRALASGPEDQAVRYCEIVNAPALAGQTHFTP